MKDLLSKIQILNRRHLKFIAAISMLIDHLAVFIYSNLGMRYNIYYLLRCMGRVAFPLYAYMFVEGMLKTRNPKKHVLQLFILSLISEPVFDRALMGSWIHCGHQNIIWLLLLCSVPLLVIERLPKEKGLAAFISMFVFGYIAEILNLDYGFYGVVPIFVFYMLRNHKEISILSILITFIFEASQMGLVYLAIVILLLYNGTEPKMNVFEKKFHQYFYPLHLGLITLAAMLIWNKKI